MFLSVEWAKRWLPAIFLLLSLFLPWWTMYSTRKCGLIRVPEDPSPETPCREIDLRLSFPWQDLIRVEIYFNGHNSVYIAGEGWGGFGMWFSDILLFCFVSTLILLGGLCGLSSKRKTQILGGLSGIAGVVSYFIFVFSKSPLFPSFPYFGLAQHRGVTYLWFLSVGFYLALAGSLMLLSPLFRTLIEKLKKRLKSS